MFSSVCVVVLAFAASAFGNIFITSPTASSTFNGGQAATISWIDDGKAPTLQAFGDARMGIYVGNAQQQTRLQAIVDTVNVATTSSVQFTPNPAIGPNSNQYFIRVESLHFADPAQPQYPAEAFSSKFTLASMTGTFNASVQAQIDGQSTAPIGGATSAAAGPTASRAATTTTGSASRSGSSAASATRSSGASTFSASTTLGALVGVLAVFGVAL